MTRKRRTVELIEEITPDMAYRTTLSEELFALGPQAAADKEKVGELPPSSPLSASSRFRVWFGWQILEHRAAMQKLAAEQLVAKRAATPTPQPAGLAAHKIRKQKLRPPAKQRQRESA